MKEFSRSFIYIAFLSLVILFLNLISSILLPFIVGIIIAYFLDPATDKLEARGWSRGLATLFILYYLFQLLYYFLIV